MTDFPTPPLSVVEEAWALAESLGDNPSLITSTDEARRYIDTQEIEYLGEDPE